jgi:hypothetical protein
MLSADPYPVSLSSPVNFTLAGQLKEEILETSVINAQATVEGTTYGYIIDFCDAVRGMGGNCPINTGEQSLTVEFVLPNVLPAGLIPFRIEALNQDGVVIFCFETQIQVVE